MSERFDRDDVPDTECEDCRKPLYSISFDRHERVLCSACITESKRRLQAYYEEGK